MTFFFFKFDPRKGQIEVKLGQIRPNFKIEYFVPKTCLSCVVLSQDSKNVNYFYVRQIKMSNIAFQKCDVITFPVFLAIVQPKTKIVCLFISF